MTDEPDWRQQLCDRYPFLRHGGFPSVGDGWRSILEQLCADVETEIKTSKIEEFGVLQIKEKWGGLCFYYSCSDYKNNNLRTIVDAAESKSMVTCEVCGKPGEVRTTKDNSYWHKCCCMKHYLNWPIDSY